MKHIHTKYLGSTRPFLAMAEPKKVSLCSFGLAKTFLCAMLAASPILTYAQNGEEAATTDEDGKKVHVAFREVEKDDLLGGVSVVDVKELTKKKLHHLQHGQHAGIRRWLERCLIVGIQ